MTEEEIILDADDRMEKALDFFRQELVGLRTGRTSPALVDSVRVNYYGNPTPLKQMANVSAPEPNQLIVRPFDPSAIKEIEKAILASDLGLTPQNDGKVVRINVPALSGDQRKKLCKKVTELAEDARVSIRNIRRDANKHADTAQKDKTMTEDDVERVKEKIQELTKKFEGKVNDVAEKKSVEIME